MKRLALAAVSALAAGCGSSTIETTTTAAQRGEALASDPGFSESRYNAFACTTCHPVAAPDPAKILPGAPLAGAVRRPTFWGGRFVTLADAVDECATKMMRGAPLDRASKKAVDLWAWLESIADQGPQTAQPFDVVYAIADQPGGDPARGAGVWASSCQSCHGAPRTGEGRLRSRAGEPVASIVPNDTIDYHAADGADVVRLVVVEKIRHGSYLGFAGTMPPFSRQALTDGQIADLLAYLAPFDP